MKEERISKMILDRLKGFKIVGNDIYFVARDFPMIFGSLLQMMLVKFSNGAVVNLRFDPIKFQTFIKDLSYAIENKEFDNLDNIVLSLLESYHYQIPPYIISIDFCPEQKNKFISTCNSFKNKEWNGIVDIFIDELYLLLNSSTIQGGTLHLGTAVT